MLSVLARAEPRVTTELGELPQSWELLELGDMFDVRQGKALSVEARRGRAPRPFLRTANVLWGRLDLTTVDRMDFTEEESEKLALQLGDLLVCEGGEIGRTAVWNREIEGCLYQNHIHRLRKRRPDVVPEFVMYWMQAAFLHLGLYGGIGNRTTIPNLSGARLKQLRVPHPPFLEQSAISTVLARIQAAVLLQEKVVAVLKELKAATMAKLFREGLRGEPLKQTEIGEIPESWEVRPCGEVCEQISVGIVVTPARYYSAVGVPCFRSFNILEDRLLERDFVFLSPEHNELHRKSKLRSGDVLIVRTGYPGTACVVPPSYDGANCVDLVFARPKAEMVLSDYLARFLNSPGGRRQVLMVQGGLAQQHLNVSAVHRLLVPVPVKDEQAAISRVGTLMDRRICVAETRSHAAGTLFASMLNALMTGRVRVTGELGSSKRSKEPSFVASSARLEVPAFPPALPAVAAYVAKLARRFDPGRIILFGSHADGTATPDSDVDLLVIMDFDGRAAKQAARMDAALDRDFPLDLLVRRPREVQAALAGGDPFMREIVEKGVVLHARPE